MKYYIKAKNTETGKTMIMTTVVFTSKKKAQEFADKIADVVWSAELTVIKEDEA